MLTKLQRTLKFHLNNNITYYIILLCGFICGGIIAAVCVWKMSEFDYKELSVYFNDFFSGINKTGADSLEIFRLSVMSNFKLYVFMILLSMMIIGYPLLPLISATFGYSVFFALFFVFKAYTIKGVLFYLCAMFPHHLISFPCHSVALMNSMQFSISIIKGKAEIKNRLFRYLVKMLIFFLITVLSSLLQGYIEPVLIRLISKLFLM
ncbi:MAG: stage II sporulation protein M [Clostridia bacterium]|nr:stage II sporulation protein M [Clostridia bacterium]